MVINHLVTKSKAAFLMTCNRLFEQFPRSVYFWTFTYTDVHPDWWYPMRWNEFQTALKKKFGYGCFPGIRVVEVHPGGHGLHYHALVVKRLNWHIVRRVAKQHDIGVLWVKKADKNTGLYLAKYLTKDNDLSPGMRKWGCTGGFKGIAKNSVVVESPLTRNIQWIQKEMEGTHFSYAFFLYLSKQTMLHGDIRDWPVKEINRSKYPPNWKAQKVKDIIEKPDDDGINVPQHLPFIYRLKSMTTIRIKNEWGEWVERQIPCKVEQPF